MPPYCTAVLCNLKVRCELLFHPKSNPADPSSSSCALWKLSCADPAAWSVYASEAGKLIYFLLASQLGEIPICAHMF